MALPVSVELAGNTEDDNIVTREAIKLEARDAFGVLTDADWTFAVTQFFAGWSVSSRERYRHSTQRKHCFCCEKKPTEGVTGGAIEKWLGH
ncbi:hypothetical protein QW180_18195 [Vibrio sinaloensis]|nr:hypothetical protein [Vibrio sinaloensis]